MTADERAEVFRRHEALHQDLADSGEMLNSPARSPGPRAVAVMISTVSVRQPIRADRS
ncbi:hypothetical protein [Streptomyces sp. NPDC001070]